MSRSVFSVTLVNVRTRTKEKNAWRPKMINKASAMEFISSSFNNLSDSAELEEDPEEPKSLPSR